MASAQPPHGFLYLNHYGQGGGGTRSYYQGESIESSENQVKKENKTQPQEQDMEIGYEDNPLLQTFEGLDKKFLNEIMKLVKEQTDAEDAENVRHRESFSLFRFARVTNTSIIGVERNASDAWHYAHVHGVQNM
ncbi:uncharacterized protein LOC110817208 isoform X3 [Carica papaya]|uniref:uncharacterized protein LOC110817208 isoform X3 n=1 Tax=Carica papaya TaxID=3649 RepID=UPI000B8CE7BA|nr:uncharacterized protein LOC110817208 isoform X3 [Carica papaya]